MQDCIYLSAGTCGFRAYVNGALSDNFKDFSGGSFQDMTRVARLNENMWTELFLDNGDNLANEIDSLIARMQAYSTAD